MALLIPFLCSREYYGVRLSISLTSRLFFGEFTILSMDFLYYRPPVEATRFLDFFLLGSYSAD